MAHEVRRTQIRTLIKEANPSIAVIHVIGTVTNRGRTYGKVVGGAAATLTDALGGEGHHQACESGEGLASST